MIFVVTYEHTGRWINPEFTIVGAYHGFQRANEQAMKYFSELNINIEDSEWKEASLAWDINSYARGHQTWHMGWDGCLTLCCDDGKHGIHLVNAGGVETIP